MMSKVLTLRLGKYDRSGHVLPVRVSDRLYTGCRDEWLHRAD